VSTATQPVSSQPAAPAPLPGTAPQLVDPPRLAEGVELLGEFKDSGDSQPPSLVRRPDGQVIQLSKLLYLVASHLDGTRSAATIAELVSGDLGRTLNAEQARYVIAEKLAPLGIVAIAGRPAAAPTADPLLALKARGTLLPARAANAAGTLLRALFRPPVVLAVIAVAAATDFWVFTSHQLAAGLAQILRDPAGLVLVAALTVLSAAFHELGHAAGCSYGGGRPGRIGAGIYLIWPSFFTNVTDSYRLSRAGRLRTDLGGLYFNLIFILALAGLYAATNDGILLLVIVVIHLEMIEQLLPFARFDGYFILSDIIGVPDLFARIPPILTTALAKATRRARPADPRITGMRRKARVAVAVWVAVTVPLLLGALGYLLLHLPSIDRALWHASATQARQLAAATATGHYAAAAADTISMLLAGLSGAGSLYLLGSLARRAATTSWRRTAGRPARRLLAAVTAAAFLTALALYWTLQGQFTGW
jgi:putative peptide zinc metalloprotease protein